MEAIVINEDGQSEFNFTDSETGLIPQHAERFMNANHLYNMIDLASRNKNVLIDTNYFVACYILSSYKQLYEFARWYVKKMASIGMRF